MSLPCPILHLFSLLTTSNTPSLFVENDVICLWFKNAKESNVFFRLIGQTIENKAKR